MSVAMPWHRKRRRRRSLAPPDHEGFTPMLSPAHRPESLPHARLIRGAIAALLILAAACAGLGLARDEVWSVWTGCLLAVALVGIAARLLWTLEHPPHRPPRE